MGCNHDNGCLNIYRNTYPSIKNNIDSSVSNINGQLNDIVFTLTSLYIPDDYLGMKVKEKIEDLNNLFGEDLESIKLEKDKIDLFISNKITEHKSHYDSWKKAQEEQNV